MCIRDSTYFIIGGAYSRIKGTNKLCEIYIGFLSSHASRLAWCICCAVWLVLLLLQRGSQSHHIHLSIRAVSNKALIDPARHLCSLARASGPCSSRVVVCHLIW
eukprot:Mycagemm_TRINITY_DN4111_c0_g2::TRINITY_DN4111_c0_g2_i1::g.4701::m.4701 type:complete len:104 gc:universal TRINITY_DN4111_c0_g2_i1:333-22(-)